MGGFGGREPLDITEQVTLALRTYSDLPAVRLANAPPDGDLYLATPDRLVYALGWIVANAIVGARFADSAIDAVPIFHPEHGWDRFLLTRRLSADRFRDEAADAFGMLMLDGDDAPRLTLPSGETRLALGTLLRSDPEAAVLRAVDAIPSSTVGLENLGPLWATRRRFYPVLFQALTEVLIAHPGLVVAREIFVDDQPIDGAYHPLYLHGIALEPQVVYNWLMAQTAERVAFIRVSGGNVIYETDRASWRSVGDHLSDQPLDVIKERIAGWLRMDGRQPAN